MRVPAETEPHERTLICWPARPALYGEWMADAEAAHAEVAACIAGYEPVTVIAPPGSGERVADRCGAGVDVVEIPIDDSWARDTGPIYALDEDGLVALDFTFNGWGGRYPPWDEDDALARRWAEHAGHASRRADLVLEGGAIAVDGQGTLVTTEQCLLHPNRNPALTRSEIEDALRRHLGVSTVLWLPYGLALDADTDGHVDNVAAFARPGVVVVQGCDDSDEPDWLRCGVNVRCARGAPDAAGTPLEVIEVPVLPFVDHSDRRLCVPYLNYYAGNGFVAVPVCGHGADADMLSLIGEQYPGRDVVGVDVGAILAFGGGGIHCVTQHVPAVEASRDTVPGEAGRGAR